MLLKRNTADAAGQCLRKCDLLVSVSDKHPQDLLDCYILQEEHQFSYGRKAIHINVSLLFCYLFEISLYMHLLSVCLLVCAHVHLWVCTCHCVCGVRGQLCGVSLYLCTGFFREALLPLGRLTLFRDRILDALVLFA